MPGLIEVARLCGFANLRPEPQSTPDLIAGLASAARVRTLSSRQRYELIASSEDWWDRYDIVESWFEDSDAAQAALDKARSARAAETALWKWLETRRDWWARILARAAEVLEAARGCPVFRLSIRSADNREAEIGVQQDLEHEIEDLCRMCRVALFLNPRRRALEAIPYP